MLHRRGFGARWRSWFCGLLASAQMTIMINGRKGDPIQLARGVRQGDPLSPVLFILAIDSLHAILHWAARRGLLADLGLHSGIPRASIYADDAVIFFRPALSDMTVILANLLASGLTLKSAPSHVSDVTRKLLKRLPTTFSASGKISRSHTWASLSLLDACAKLIFGLLWINSPTS